MQHEIKTARPLLDDKGNIAEPGYAKKLYPLYRRADIKAPALRIKEWDYYLVNNGRFALALTIDNNGYMNMNSVSLLDFEEKWEITNSPMKFFPGRDPVLPETSVKGDVSLSGKGHSIRFENPGTGIRRLTADFAAFGKDGRLQAEVELFDEPEESMVICTPFEKQGHFYYNQKINCMRARGETVQRSIYLILRNPLPCWPGVAEYGHIIIPGTGGRLLIMLTACPSDGISGTASGILPLPVRTCCSTTAGHINSAR